MNPQKYKSLRSLGVVTTPFGGKTRGEPVHPGIDIANKPGTPIPAFADGKVVAAGPTTNGMGNIVAIKDTAGNTHQYGHLGNVNVKKGQEVKKGQALGPMGSSGNSYSPSGGDPTHLDVRIADAYGRWQNPSKILKQKIS
jgi:murein DD-endopeptidase MepM/ murein hydrolase activator NlpD